MRNINSKANAEADSGPRSLEIEYELFNIYFKLITNKFSELTCYAIK